MEEPDTSPLLTEGIVHLGPSTMREALTDAATHAREQLDRARSLQNSGNESEADKVLKERAQALADLQIVVERLMDRGESIPQDLKVMIQTIADKARQALIYADDGYRFDYSYNEGSGLYDRISVGPESVLGPNPEDDVLSPLVARFYPDNADDTTSTSSK